MFDMPMDHIDQDFVDGPGLAAALSLPQKIAVSPEHFLVGTPRLAMYNMGRTG